MNDEFYFMLDDKKIPFSEGETIMDAALNAGHYIPHLCHNPEFTPHGSCRVCIVNINGRNVSACTFPAATGLIVKNNTAGLMAERRTLLQMLFVEGNHVCPGCEQSGSCQLQAVAYYCEMLTPGFKHFYPLRDLDASHPDYIIDYNRCILCELCVRASNDADHKAVFSMHGRGLDRHLIVNSPTGRLEDSDFDKTDKAAHVCPVGAIIPKQQGYRQPIGKRLYDQSPIDEVGDKASHE